MPMIQASMSPGVSPASMSQWIAAASLSLFAALAFGCGDILDRPGNYTHYENGRSALDDHVVERGVLPAWFPPEATDIHVQTELDVGHSWARFSVRPEDIDRIIQNAKRITISEFEDRQMSGLSGTAWWDSCAGVDLSPTCEQRFTYYQIADSRSEAPGYLAVDAKGDLYYWSK